MNNTLFKLTSHEVATNIGRLREFMEKRSVDAFYISSFDEYLNEYTPLHECHRYYFSGFTGSTAELLVTLNKVYLFVDGRYHEQADLEVDKKVVTVKKETNSIFGSLLEVLKSEKIKNIGLESDRTPLRYSDDFAQICKVHPFSGRELHSFTNFKKDDSLKEIYPLNENEAGESFKEKAKKIISSNENAVFISSLDSIAWLANARGFHLPCQSTFLSKAILTASDLTVFLKEGTPLSKEPFDLGVHFIHCQEESIEKHLSEIKISKGVRKVMFNPSTLTVLDLERLKRVFDGGIESCSKDPIIPFQSIKSKVELKEMRRSFVKSNRVIAQAALWLKKEVAKKQNVSELDFFNKTNEIYKKAGAIDLSFNTIAAVGDHSSIIHFGSPEAKRKVKDGDLILLDSGALFRNGFATDTTRTFLVGKNPKKKIYKEIYTLVLKGLINAESAAIPALANGAYIDSLARDPIVKAGYNYAHGTGHGVGINVHEGGIRFSSASDTRLVVGQVVSVEPGIYLPKIGGVRLENVVEVVPHKKIKGMLALSPLTLVGFDHSLIDYKMLTKSELSYLKSYELLCKKAKTQLK